MDMISVNRRPEKLWRFLQFPLTRIVLAVVPIVLLAVLLFSAANAAHLHGIAGAAVQLSVGLGACLVYILYVRLIERRKVSELSAGDFLPQFSKGFLLGFLLISATILVLWMSGIYSVLGMNPLGMVAAPLLGAIGSAFLEEIVIRGVLFRIIEESLGTWLALGLSALIFGLLHGLNPGATWVSILAIALESGVLLAAVYIYARQLWIGIGLHCAWNFSEGGIYGASVSGGKGHGLLSAQFQGADLLTGGQFGPEASIVAVAICFIAGGIFLLLARRRGHIIAPFWQRAQTGS